VIDPLDYEAVISELEAEFREDPLQDLLLFPDLDFTVSTFVPYLCVCKSNVYLSLVFIKFHMCFGHFFKSVCSEKALF